jgi:hypothetical protein
MRVKESFTAAWVVAAVVAAFTVVVVGGPAAAAATVPNNAATTLPHNAAANAGTSPLRGDPTVDGMTAAQAQAAASASRTAKAAGTATAVPALTTSYSTTVANPSGSFTVDTSVQPERVQRGNGWVPIDTTLVRHSDGTFGPMATLNALTLSGGGSGPFASMTADGATMAVSWPGPLPPPQVRGSTATYRDVLAGVDLQVVARVDGGFSDVLVVHDAKAAANPALAALTFPVTTRGVSVQAEPSGAMSAVDAHGQVMFAAPAPLMWDSGTVSSSRVSADQSTVEHPGLAATQRRLGVRVSGSTLTLVPDHTLLSSRTARFPMFIDPTYTPQNHANGAKAHFVEVKSGCASAQPPNSLYDNTGSAGDNGQLGVGFMDFAGGCEGTDRAYYSLTVPSQIWGPNVAVSSAFLDTTVVYAAANGANNGNKVFLHAVSAISANTDWNHQPAAGTTVTSATFNTSNNFPNVAVGFTVTSQLQSLANAKASSWTVGLRSNWETSNDIDFVRFADNPHLEITYDHTPTVPAKGSMSATSGTTSLPCVTSGTLPWLGKAAQNTPPTLKATISDPDGNAVSATFHYLKAGGTAAALPVTAIVSSNSAVSASLPQSFITGLGTTSTTTIEYYVTAFDGQLTSANSVTCEFNYDPATPAAPSVNSNEYPPVPAAASTRAGTQGNFTVTSATGESVTHFVYRLDGVPPTGSGQCTGNRSVVATNNAATIPITPRAPGTHTFYVYGCDAANNISDVSPYQFVVAGDPDASYSNLAAAFNDVGIATTSTTSGSANADGSGNSLDNADLQAAGWTPQSTITVDGASITLPKYGTGSADNVMAAKQTIAMQSTGTALVFLTFASSADTPALDFTQAPIATMPLIPTGVGVAGVECSITDGAPSDCVPPTGTLTYVDANGTTSTQTFTLTVPDWVHGPTAQAVLTLPERNTPSGTQALQTSIYAFSVPLDPTKTLTQVTLPDVSDGPSSNNPGLHILGMGVRGAATTGAPAGDSWAGAFSAPVEASYAPSSGSWDNQTVRTVVTPGVGGTVARVTLSNTGNPAAVNIGAASIAPQSTGAATTGAPVALKFNNSTGVTIPAGAEVTSDPITLSSITAFAPLLVSYRVSNASIATLPGHGGGTSYVTASNTGDHTGDTAATAFSLVPGHSLLLSRVDIAAAAGTPTVVVVGNNVVVGSPATPPAGVVPFSGLLAQQASGYTVVDASIENNQIATDVAGTGGPSTLARLDRDVLDVPGVNTVIVDEGLADLLGGAVDTTVIADDTALVHVLNAWGLNVIIGTITPCHGFSPCTSTIDDASGAGFRTPVNQKIGDNANDTFTPLADAVDFDQTVATTDANGFEVLTTAADAGDHVNLTAAGTQDLLSAQDGNGTTLTDLLSQFK